MKQKNLLDIKGEIAIGDLELDLADRSERFESENFDVERLLRRRLSDSIKHSPLSRYEIAARMSELLGREITKYQLDSWTAESKEGYHLPAAYVPALAAVLGDTELLRILARPVGVRIVENRDLVWLEYAKARELEKKAKLKRKLLEKKLKEK